MRFREVLPLAAIIAFGCSPEIPRERENTALTPPDQVLTPRVETRHAIKECSMDGEGDRKRTFSEREIGILDNAGIPCETALEYPSSFSAEDIVRLRQSRISSKAARNGRDLGAEGLIRLKIGGRDPETLPYLGAFDIIDDECKKDNSCD